MSTQRPRRPPCRRAGTLLGLLSLWTALACAGQVALPPPGPERLLSASAQAYADMTLSGGPGKDGIPAIDQPRFSDAAGATQYLRPDDIVFGVHHRGQARAYPQRILVWHEIVNDNIAGEPLSITYCPLTATVLGFMRGDSQFGVSGRLLNSNVVMYDRGSDSQWSQIAGAAISGPASGRRLQEIRVFWSTWANWQARHPETQVLTRDTGALRNYRRDPYGSYNPLRGYYADPQLMFPVMHQHPRYPAKHSILGFRTAHTAVAVDKRHLREQGLIQHSLGDEHFVIIDDPGLDTGWVFRAEQPVQIDRREIRFEADGPQAPGLDALEPLNAFEAMWFAWYAFYPDTVVLDGR
ncbi:DUF3179 domain-containing protein [Pseudomonas sp. LPB0260]|uniref:DUF3179 domain-containing protein n=1 Tax=Pseudomonas sp. LPB0260 TaxID=2614442 RepID=UPI0015C1EEF1|nr:DUF3179 domain-containing protein [Pseudomonas sp. LPB0260]QLC74623.1 DUF3179 domain-containing protein [Pseudomonas sp. LPB0260]QLC77391.1 DUF3179 domain-containing protein [Pseudomonas sp. LPB0260]